MELPPFSFSWLEGAPEVQKALGRQDGSVCALCCWVTAVIPKVTCAHSELTSW